MPFPFTLPTTSVFSFSTSFSSPTHPSLLTSATTHRSLVRSTLKSHKRLSPPQQSTHLPTLLQALEAYIPYLLAVDAGLSSRHVSDQEVEVTSSRTERFAWRAVLSTSSISPRQAPRLTLSSLEHEIAFVLATLAYTHTLLARSTLQPIYNPSTSATLTASARTAAITSALKSLLVSASVHAYISTRLSSLPVSPAIPPDLSPSLHAALSSLAHAEATLLAVAKDDPYPPFLSSETNPNDRDWMISSPTLPKVRAALFARLCIGASDHAAKAGGLLGGVKEVSEGLVDYVEDLRRVGRARGARFLGVDAEMSGETGLGLGWLDGARSVLTGGGGGSLASNTSSTSKKFSIRSLKASVQEKREEARVSSSREWGLDAGKAEEARVIQWLGAKWGKMNDTVNTQLIAPYGPLLGGMPLGREFVAITAWKGAELGVDELQRLRGPAMQGEMADEFDVDSEDEGERKEYAGRGGYY